MADDVKITTVVKTPTVSSKEQKTAAKPVATKPVAAKPAATKPATVKPAVAKPAAKKTAAAKPATKSVAKPAAKKTAPKTETTAARGGRKKVIQPSLDLVTTALWQKIEKVDVSGVEAPIAIQVIVNDFGTFFIAVKEEDGKKTKHIIQEVYNDRDGTLEVSYDEIMKIAKGKYDFSAAINKGVISYQGDVRKALILADLFD
ncbi:MAG: SCP2 sterol-binding domain-containing protein [Oscillospiraceae bacterium]|nr:SCP2 sterol-binding domain-containing protein [Oscillospiraceae bacterium]